MERSREYHLDNDSSITDGTKIDRIRLANEIQVREELARQRRVLLIHKIIENEESCFTRMKIRLRFFISHYIYKND